MCSKIHCEALFLKFKVCVFMFVFVFVFVSVDVLSIFLKCVCNLMLQISGIVYDYLEDFSCL